MMPRKQPHRPGRPVVVKALITHSKAALLWCFLAGASLPLAFAPFNFFLLAYFAPLVLFYYWSAASPKRAALMGFLFGLGLFGVGVSWVYVAIHVFGYAAVPLAVLLTSAFVAVLALFPALTGLYVGQIATAFWFEPHCQRAVDLSIGVDVG